MAESEPSRTGPVGSAYTAPFQEFLGFECESCHQDFPVMGPLDPIAMPPDRPWRIGSRAPLPGKCPHCGHEATYPVARLKRLRKTA